MTGNKTNGFAPVPMTRNDDSSESDSPALPARLSVLELAMHQVLNVLAGGNSAMLDAEHDRMAALWREALGNTQAIRPDKALLLAEYREHVLKALDLLFAHAKSARSPL